MPKQKITLTAIAKKSGLSIASVSRVIHKPHVTKYKTQALVHSAIAELECNTAKMFKPHIYANRSYKILVIDNQFISNSLINHGIESKAKELGYKIIYLRLFYFSEQDICQIISYTINHCVDGLLIINDSPYLKSLLEYQTALPPIVLVNQFSSNLPCVYFDHLSIGYQATQYLIEQGHKRIGILLGEANQLAVSQIKDGYTQALMRANVLAQPYYTAYGCVDYDSSGKAVKQMMELSIPPTAIICCDHTHLVHTDGENWLNQAQQNEFITAESTICGLIDQCRIMRINIPNDLLVLQFIHSKNHKQYNPLNYICALYKPLFKMGSQSIELLVSITESICKVRLSKLIECELVTRQKNINKII